VSSPIVSVVTPVYNGATYLEECIRSVLGQTLADWEYVIVDNASTDDTVEIADRYADDPRISVVRATEFLGIYGNHNRALGAINPVSRYVKVVHADDWLYPECLERMVHIAERHPPVGVVGAYRLRASRVGLDSIPWGQEVTPGREILRQSLTGGPYVTGSPSSLLIRTSLFADGNPFYDETFWHSDTEAIYRSLTRSDFGFVHQVLTFTRVHEQSNTPFSQEIGTYTPENIRMLNRHGHGVLSPTEYRHQMRRELRDYGWFLAKQAVKPSRRRDPRFRDFHRGVLERILEEVGDDYETRAAIRMCDRLLVGPRSR
jgi:glycosyltransferase involved in cell wall biosynthesis